MDDRAWIREDTRYAASYTTRLTHLQQAHIYNEMLQSNWCNRMAKDV